MFYIGVDVASCDKIVDKSDAAKQTDFNNNQSEDKINQIKEIFGSKFS